MRGGGRRRTVAPVLSRNIIGSQRNHIQVSSHFDHHDQQTATGSSGGGRSRPRGLHGGSALIHRRPPSTIQSNSPGPPAPAGKTASAGGPKKNSPPLGGYKADPGRLVEHPSCARPADPPACWNNPPARPDD